MGWDRPLGKLVQVPGPIVPTNILDNHFKDHTPVHAGGWRAAPPKKRASRGGAGAGAQGAAAVGDGIDAYVTRRKWEDEDHPYDHSEPRICFRGCVASSPCSRIRRWRSWSRSGILAESLIMR